MTEKLLTESTWKAFAKGKSIDDAATLKALAALARAGDDAKAQLGALDAIDGALTALRRTHKADRAISAHLGDTEQAAARMRKQAEAAQRDAASDAEDDSPALLSTKMLPLLRELRKGEARMHCLVTTAGKETAVLIMRKPIAPSRRKLMLDAVGVKGGAKHFEGECLLEDNQLTFVMQGPGGGLAKRIREALLAQLGLRLRVRVRGDDGVEADGVDEGAPESDTDTSTASAGSSASPQPTDTARAAFDQALALLRERIDQALANQHPQSTKLRAVEAFAHEKVEAGDVAGGLKALAMLRQLLDAPAVPPNAPPGREAALEGWRRQRDSTVTMLKALAGEVAASGDAEAKAAIIEIQAVVKHLSGEPSTAQQVAELMRWLESDDVVSDVDEIGEPMRAPLMERLVALQATMASER